MQNYQLSVTQVTLFTSENKKVLLRIVSGFTQEKKVKVTQVTQVTHFYKHIYIEAFFIPIYIFLYKLCFEKKKGVTCVTCVTRPKTL